MVNLLNVIPRSPMQPALLFVSLLCLLSPLGHSNTQLERILGTSTNSSDYARKLHRLSDETERAIVHAGAGAMLLMNLLDDEIDFGGSDYWTAPIGTRGSTSIACALGGGIEATATRDDYRRVSGSMYFNNCVTTLGRISGEADFSHDDAVWTRQSNPKTAYALTITFRNVNVVSRDGRTYRATSGAAYCDSQVNHPLERYVVDPFTNYVTEYYYGRDDDRPLLSQYENFSGYTYGNDGWEVEDFSGRIKENIVEAKWSCDLKNASISVGNQTHLISDLKFSSSAPVYGDNSFINYHVSQGRADRLKKIGSGSAIAGGASDQGRFRHQEFGLLEVGSGVRYWGDWASTVVADDRYPAGARIEYVFFRNGNGGENYWSLEQANLVGGDYQARLGDLDENGTVDNYETLQSSFFLTRQKCALRADGDVTGTHYFEMDEENIPEPIKALRSNTACLDKNHWFVSSKPDGSFLASYQADDDLDGIDKYFDDDDDNDGVEDELDAFPTNPLETKDTDSDGIGNRSDTDDDNDGVRDEEDFFPLDPSESIDTDLDGIGNNSDVDDDGDDVVDSADAYPLISLQGRADSDGDGRPNDCDAVCQSTGMAADTDDDSDGVVDVLDAYPLVPLNGLTDTDGDGSPNDCDATCQNRGMTADTDDDGDGVVDIEDAYPLIPLDGLTDTDSDGRPNDCDTNCQNRGMAADTDDDGDGVLDKLDHFPLDRSEILDTDSDGIGNNADIDDDGDGLTDLEERKIGTNQLDSDTDGDSMDDGFEVKADLDPIDDSDCPRWFCPRIAPSVYLTQAPDFDLDGDGLSRRVEERLGTDFRRSDSDADGLTDGEEVALGSDPLNTDTDADGLTDRFEVELGTSPVLEDSDGDSMNDAVEISKDLDPMDSSDCPRWFCGGNMLPYIFAKPD